MRILVLNYEYPPIGGGASPVSGDISKKLVELDHKVTVITMGYKDLPAYEKDNEVEIYRVKCLRSQKFVCYPYEQLTYIFSALFFLYKHLKNNTYDICLCHFIIPTGAIAYWLKKIYKLPYVIFSQGSDVPGYNSERFTFLHKILHYPWKKICNNSEQIIVPSNFLKQLISKAGSDKICSIIPNCININDFHAGKKEKIFLTMCRLQHHKNVHLVIKAFAESRLKDWKLFIIGDGPELENLKKLSKELDIESSVIFTGWVKRGSNEQLKILSKSSIFISPSSFESFGVSVLEALASGCIAVLSDIPGHEQFKNFGAISFNHNSSTELTEKMLDAIKINPTIPEGISFFDWQTNMLKLENILKRKI